MTPRKCRCGFSDAGGSATGVCPLCREGLSMPTDRGFYWVLIRSLWRDSEPEWDLAHSDGRGHWLRCSTGMHLEPENVAEVGAKVEREETKPVGEEMLTRQQWEKRQWSEMESSGWWTNK